jgi:hypothetical protein
LDDLTKKYEIDKNSLQIMPEDMREIRKKELRRSFDENLLKLMKKTRDPKLFARIIREGGKIDAVGVRACIPVLEKLLNAKVAIVVENADQSARQVHGDMDNAEHKIRLKIGDQHYTLDGSTADTNTGEGNNCLLFALESQLTQAGVKHADFRELLAQTIETNKNISNIVSKGLHRYGICEGFVGGDKLNSLENKYFDVEKDTTYDFMESKDVDNRNLMAKHTELVKKLSDELNIDPNKLIDAGEAKTLLEQKGGAKLEELLIRINNDNLADSFNVAFDKAMDRMDKVCKELKLTPEARKDLKERVRAVFQAKQ